MNIKEYADLRQCLFAVIDRKTSWGKLELKEAIDAAILDWGAKNCTVPKNTETNVGTPI